MRIRTLIGWLCGALAFALAWSAAYGDESCAARSPAHRVALVELYSSEGCDSCPPADRWLSLNDSGEASAIVPLALHVDYWNSLGWVDRFSQHRFTERQETLAGHGASHVVYTPEVFVAGREMREWAARERFNDRVREIAAQRAPADVAIRLTRRAAGALQVEAQFAAPASAQRPLNAYVAVYENDLESRVSAGENRGATLHHDRVVREWLGPVPLIGGAARISRELALGGASAGGDASAHGDAGLGAASAASAERFGVVAFVEDPATSEVLQVADLPVCRR